MINVNGLNTPPKKGDRQNELFKRSNYMLFIKDTFLDSKTQMG